MKKITINVGTKLFYIFGGQYHNAPFGKDWCLVKMAKEITKPCNISIPTEDFSTPDEDQLILGLKRAYIALFKGKKVYAGCMGGIGRTGLFLASMVKVASYVMWGMDLEEYGYDPVSCVRSQYSHHAVETVDQQIFINDLEVFDVVTLVNGLARYKFLRILPESWLLWWFG